MAPARAGADDAHFAVAIRLRLEPLHCRRRVAHDLIVRNATLGPYFRGDVIRRAVTDAAVQIRTDGVVAMVREPARELLVELVPARHVHDDHHARRAISAFWSSDVRMDLITIGARNLDRASRHRLRSARVERIPHTRRCYSRPSVRRSFEQVDIAPRDIDVLPTKLAGFENAGAFIELVPGLDRHDLAARRDRLLQVLLVVRPVPTRSPNARLVETGEAWADFRDGEPRVGIGPKRRGAPVVQAL